MTRFPRHAVRLVATLALASLWLVPRSTLHAQAPASSVAAAPRAPNAEDFDRTEVLVPTRDGVRLHTLIFVPKGATADLPIILTRTPYGIASAPRVLGASYAELAQDGYIFAFQDIRGRYGSEGQFVMLRPMRDKADPKAVDESSDTQDTIDWLLKNVPRNNGRVGMLGVSYPGWLTVMAMLDPHPALKAVSPQASPADMFIGDDFHHNGAFRLSYGFEYAAAMETGKEITPFKFDSTADLYDWYLKLGSLAHVNERILNGRVPTWNDFASHPNYDAFWQRQGVAKYLDRVKVPTLSVAGWWDQEDFYGPIKIYETLEPHDTQHRNYLVVGPWNHGGWSGASGQKLGDVDFGSETAKDYRKNIQAPWFAYWLKGRGKLDLAEATTFEAGTNQWVKHESWPPKKNVSPRRLYTAANGQLSWSPPTDASPRAFDSYVSDPANPVPYRQRPIRPLFSGGGTWSRWLVDDQSFLKGRPDVLTWETPVLTEDVVIAGAIKANLMAATTGSDADWVVKLIDVYPADNPSDPKLNGHALMVANDVLRARFRHGYEHPEPITPNKVETFVVDLHSQNYRFRKGHKIQIQTQSTWFPLIDRNPQTFVPNIFQAKDSDFKAATQRIYRSQGAATYVELPVVTPALVP